MKKITFSMLVTFFFSGAIFQSCLGHDDNNYNYDIAIGTLQKNAAGIYFLQLDNDKKLLARDSSVIHYYKMEAGKRVLAKFRYVEEEAGKEYGHAIRIDNIYPILTKPVIRITPEEEDSIADDKIELISCWVSKQYLNIEYRILGSNSVAHMLNLVEAEKQKEPGKGYVSLEFRHNRFNDPGYNRYGGIVSFDLSALNYQPGAEGIKGINLRVNTIYQDYRIYKIDYAKQTKGGEKIIPSDFSLKTE